MVVETRSWQGLISELHPLNRVHNSGDFVKALGLIRDWIHAEGFRGTVRILEYPAGQEFNFWRIPPRWDVLEFCLSDRAGRPIADQSFHPLVVTPYSDSYVGTIGRDELLRRIHSREDLPEAVPFVFRRMYRHWESGWSLALPKSLADRLTEPEYHVTLRTQRCAEPMTLLEYSVEGDSPEIVQLAAHLDHPGQCNDSLSGVLGALCAIRQFEAQHPRSQFTLSALIVPEIVGSAVYLASEAALAHRIRYCLCPNMLGHDAPLAICVSKGGRSQLDKACRLAAMAGGSDHVVGAWHKYPDCGDEISYDAPGIDIPASTISRIGELFPYYHSSKDTPDSVTPARFEEAVAIMAKALSYLERNALPLRSFAGLPALANPDLDLYLEPRNMNNLLNPAANQGIADILTGEPLDLRLFQEFFLSNIEGRASLVDIALAYAIPFEFVEAYARAFAEKGLLQFRQPVVDGTYEPTLVHTAARRSGRLKAVER